MDGDLAREVRLEDDSIREAIDGEQGIERLETASAERGDDALAAPFDVDDGAHARADRRRGAGGVADRLVDRVALDVLRTDVGVHEDVREDRRLRRGVVPLEIVARIGLGDPQALRLAQRVGEARARGALREHVVAGARDDPTDRIDARERQRRAAQREDREAVGDRRLEAQEPIVFPSERLKLAIRARDGTLIGGHDVHASRERLPDVGERGLACPRLERRDLNEDVGRQIADRWERAAREVRPREDRGEVDALWRDDGPVTGGPDRRDQQRCRRRDRRGCRARRRPHEHPRQGPADVAEADKGEAHALHARLVTKYASRGAPRSFRWRPFSAFVQRRTTLVRLARLFDRSAPARADLLVVGLGNPGDGYANTRHNIGFQVANKLAKRARVEFGIKSAESRIAEGSLGTSKIAIARPQTFMNDSGKAVRKLLDRYRIDPDRMIVVYDDIDLPIGKVRIREKGGPGTHNGMRSVVSAVGEGFPRVRVGVAPTDPQAEVGDLADYVLSPFAADERAEADRAIERAAEALEVAIRDGLRRAMDRFNG